MPINRRNKGKAGEREAAKAVAAALGIEAARGQQFRGGNDSPDIVTSLADVHFEVKRCERLRIYSAIDQATNDGGDKLPVVLHRRNGREWLAVCRLEDLRRLAERICDT